MKILRDHIFLSGFLYESPLENLPAITHCGEALCARGHQVGRHRHSGFELLYLSRGATTWQAGGAQIRQQMGDLVLFYPHEWHATQHEASEETHQLWIGLELDKLGAEGRRLSQVLQEKKVRLLRGCQEAEPILRAIVGQIARNLPRLREVVLAYLKVLFAGTAEFFPSTGGSGGTTARAAVFLCGAKSRLVSGKPFGTAHSAG